VCFQHAGRNRLPDMSTNDDGRAFPNLSARQSGAYLFRKSATPLIIRCPARFTLRLRFLRLPAGRRCWPWLIFTVQRYSCLIAVFPARQSAFRLRRLQWAAGFAYNSADHYCGLIAISNGSTQESTIRRRWQRLRSDLWEFASPGPEIDRKSDGHDRQDGTEFVDEPSGLTSVAG
jgi:hypothetical protein